MRWSAIKAFAVKELKTTLRSREQLFWIVFWPMILVLMTGYIFIPPSVDQPKTLKIGVVNYDNRSTAPFNGSYFVQILDEVEYKGVKLWSRADMGTCRVEDLFVTDARYELLPMKSTVITTIKEQNRKQKEIEEINLTPSKKF